MPSRKEVKIIRLELLKPQLSNACYLINIPINGGTETVTSLIENMGVHCTRDCAEIIWALKNLEA